MQNRHHSQFKESDEPQPKTITKRLQYLNNDRSENSSSDDSINQSIYSVLLKRRDALEKSISKHCSQTINVLNISPNSDMDKDAQSPKKEAPINLTSETS